MARGNFPDACYATGDSQTEAQFNTFSIALQQDGLRVQGVIFAMSRLPNLKSCLQAGLHGRLQKE
jgi:hypothetical protein